MATLGVKGLTAWFVYCVKGCSQSGHGESSAGSDACGDYCLTAGTDAVSTGGCFCMSLRI